MSVEPCLDWSQQIYFSHHYGSALPACASGKCSLDSQALLGVLGHGYITAHSSDFFREACCSVLLNGIRGAIGLGWGVSSAVPVSRELCLMPHEVQVLHSDWQVHKLCPVFFKCQGFLLHGSCVSSVEEFTHTNVLISTQLKTWSLWKAFSG